MVLLVPNPLLHLSDATLNVRRVFAELFVLVILLIVGHLHGLELLLQRLHLSSKVSIS